MVLQSAKTIPNRSRKDPKVVSKLQIGFNWFWFQLILVLTGSGSKWFRFQLVLVPTGSGFPSPVWPLVFQVWSGLVWLLTFVSAAAKAVFAVAKIVFAAAQTVFAAAKTVNGNDPLGDENLPGQ